MPQYDAMANPAYIGSHIGTRENTIAKRYAVLDVGMWGYRNLHKPDMCAYG